MRNEVADLYEREWSAAGISDDTSKRSEADRDAIESLEPLSGVWTLEVGPGLGRTGRAMCDRGARVVAMDLTRSSLDAVRCACPEALLVQGDANRLPFREGVFDRVAVFSVMMFLDLGRAPAEFARVLKEGGRAAIVEPTAGNPMLAVYRTLFRKYARLAEWWSSERLEEAFRRSFRRTVLHHYWLVPAGAFLSDGSVRRLWVRCESAILRRLPRLGGVAWLTRLECER